MSSFDLEAWSAPRRERLSQALLALFADAWPEPMTAMCRHPLTASGKGMRPLLVLAAYGVVQPEGADDALVWPYALAIELVHAYSLVHDDMPCMDNDDFRRGQPTTHVLYGDGFALLVGDALLTEAFRVAATAKGLPPARQVKLIAELATAAGYHGMIGGQAADLGAAGQVTDVGTLERLHAGKTGALLRLAVRLGAIAGGADQTTLSKLTRYAEALGLAFQLADDVLDLEQDAKLDGPPSFPKLLGVEETRHRARALSEQAIAAITGLPRTEPLVALARYTVERSL
ncbi:polyprenyl synthetase family protein [Myxococcota bacterium]|nr:polyprenyl synthetase family protein [Myxococcota bacterium]